jgi:hypothetical protein
LLEAAQAVLLLTRIAEGLVVFPPARAAAAAMAAKVALALWTVRQDRAAVSITVAVVAALLVGTRVPAVKVGVCLGARVTDPAVQPEAALLAVLPVACPAAAAAVLVFLVLDLQVQEALTAQDSPVLVDLEGVTAQAEPPEYTAAALVAAALVQAAVAQVALSALSGLAAHAAHLHSLQLT